MKRRIVLIFLMIMPGLAMAQDGANGPNAKMREAVREKVKAYRIARLVEVLDLDEKSATRLAPLVNRAYDDIAVVTKDSGEGRRELRGLAGEPKPNEARINQLIDRLLANRVKIEKLEEDLLRDARKALSPVQVAKLVIALPEINREIQQQIRRAAAGHEPGGIGPRPGRLKGPRGGRGPGPNNDNDPNLPDETE